MSDDDKIKLPRVIYLSGDIEEDTARDFIEGLLELSLSGPTEPILIYIDTYGGDPYSMFAMHDMMRGVPCPLHTVGVGKIMSAGVLLLAAGDKRSIMPNAYVMMHQTSTEVQGTVSDIDNEMVHIGDLQQRAYELYVDYTKQNIKTIEEDLIKDKYLTAEEAITYGIVDEIMYPRKEWKARPTTTN